MAKTDEAPSAKGRPGFSFTVGSRKNLPSKWDDAEKWLINGRDSPANFMLKQCSINGSVIKHEEKHQETEGFVDELESKIVSLNHHHAISDKAFGYVILKDKLTNEEEAFFPKFKCLGAMVVKNKDTGTEMTPAGSSTGSRCPTPLKNLSPPRHNTPENRLLMDQSGSPLECDLADKLQPWTPFDAIDSNWKSLEDEEDEISKSLRHFGMENETISGPRPSAWEEQEISESCLRYQMKEAKIEAWVNLQKAKAEAQTRKLEVKIQKMRSKHEDKLMKKMTLVRLKAEELRGAARLHHSEMIGKSNKTLNHHLNGRVSGHCGCLVIYIDMVSTGLDAAAHIAFDSLIG
ncbi:hypothetical protein E3N88_05638 [Mikania micrantha]|uniref:Remorin C-terminal domain-containing protein n=1 Tax=Mikania micrantha TaxID=192012 RepID=A0A5N6PM87_9ASTR|nr:hypothetical protein E3N88_05638 [Mikania micrantha]